MSSRVLPREWPRRQSQVASVLLPFDDPIAIGKHCLARSYIPPQNISNEFQGIHPIGTHLAVFISDRSPAGTTIDVFRNTSAWNESTVTFNTKPSTAGGAVYSLNIGDGAAGVFRSWDLTSVVQDWVNGTFANLGLTLKKSPNVAPWPYFQ